MEKDRGMKVIIVFALVAAIIGLTIGFAAFTKTFTTSAFNANVSAGSNPLTSGLTMVNNTAADGTVSGTTWNIPEASLTAANSSKTFTAKFNNSSAYNAYLASATTSAVPTCTGDSSVVSKASLQEICSHVTITVKFGTTTLTTAMSPSYTATSTSAGNKLNFSSTSGSRTNYTVAASGNNTTSVTVAVAASYLPDGAVKINIPAITYTFTTLQ